MIDTGVPAAQILVSTSCAALPEAIALTRHAQDVGAWGTLLMPPFFFKGVADAGIVDGQNKLVPSVTFRIQNASQAEIAGVQINAIVRTATEPDAGGGPVGRARRVRALCGEPVYRKGGGVRA